MAFNYGNFDRNADYGSNEDFELLPDGEYEGEIESAESKPTTKGGTMIALKIRLHNRRVVFDNLNVECGNQQAEQIALRQMKTIADFNNVNIQADEDFEGLSVIAVIGTQKGTGGYRDRNVVKYYKGKEDRKSAANRPASTPSRGAADKDPRYNGANKSASRQDSLVDDEIPF
ncbi:DUF669 domain-containing protein [Acetobacter sacchari]|uniref:DUF669 domain-containing protein n=1 Tax=Acetobacter sacchari TaxID=2661687 RepID=A0ABS3M0U1_9PROT|nr:DUF669 domain-containing protein [Acetobacter sacchari]MBO1361802.1 DUF669 domain-containing protein [Acetobacter sacchari]